MKTAQSAIAKAFNALGFPLEYAVFSDARYPDIADYQIDAAFRLAKIHKSAAMTIAESIVRKLQTESSYIEDINVSGGGFVNIKFTDSYILKQLQDESEFNLDNPRQRIIVDYGGPNVAKPLHVGHLRASIIGESIKRISREMGHEVIADIHLGDWGTPMGMIIAELEERHPEWPFFQENFTANDFVPPLTVEALNELYPIASAKSKDTENKIFGDKARAATAKLQAGHAGYRSLWSHFVNLSLDSIKVDLRKLDVDFHLWYGESDADPFIKPMVDNLVATGVAVESKGALIIPVKLPNDSTEIPPLILQKKDGAATYATTDLATIVQRKKEYNPDKIFYVVDKRQSEHFVQVFRAAVKGNLIAEGVLEHTGLVL